jgi:hypothetical protein
MQSLKRTQQALAALSLRNGDEQRRTKAGKGSSADCGRKSRFTAFLLSILIAEM